MEPYAGGIGALCDMCGGEIYSDELYYRIDGDSVCPDCLEDYAALTFASCLVKASHAPR